MYICCANKQLHLHTCLAWKLFRKLSKLLQLYFLCQMANSHDRWPITMLSFTRAIQSNLPERPPPHSTHLAFVTTFTRSRGNSPFVYVHKIYNDYCLMRPAISFYWSCCTLFTAYNDHRTRDQALGPAFFWLIKVLGKSQATRDVPKKASKCTTISFLLAAKAVPHLHGNFFMLTSLQCVQAHRLDSGSVRVVLA